MILLGFKEETELSEEEMPHILLVIVVTQETGVTEAAGSLIDMMYGRLLLQLTSNIWFPNMLY